MLQNTTKIYFDNAATTPLSDEVREAMAPYWSDIYGNASSPYAVSRAARSAIDNARQQVADLIGAHHDEIVFTSGGTESDNWALLGTALAQNRDEKNHVIISAIEHAAIMETATTLRQLGCEVDIAPCDESGIVHPEEITKLLRKSTFLVSLMLVNNEVGVIQPVSDVAALLREYQESQDDGQKVLLHTDAVQAAGKIPLSGEELGVNLMSLSSHKIRGPKGMGALYVHRNTYMQSLLRGGAQERGRRAGTENVPAIIGFGAAAELAKNELDENASHMQELRTTLEMALQEIEGVTIHGKNALRAPHVCNFSLAGKRAESVVLNLDFKGIAVGTGSACASGALNPSHVLEAMQLSEDEMECSLRVSFGVQNTLDEVQQFIEIIRGIMD